MRGEECSCSSLKQASGRRSRPMQMPDLITIGASAVTRLAFALVSGPRRARRAVHSQSRRATSDYAAEDLEVAARDAGGGGRVAARPT